MPSQVRVAERGEISNQEIVQIAFGLVLDRLRRRVLQQQKKRRLQQQQQSEQQERSARWKAQKPAKSNSRGKRSRRPTSAGHSEQTVARRQPELSEAGSRCVRSFTYQCRERGFDSTSSQEEAEEQKQKEKENVDKAEVEKTMKKVAQLEAVREQASGRDASNPTYALTTVQQPSPTLSQPQPQPPELEQQPSQQGDVGSRGGGGGGGCYYMRSDTRSHDTAVLAATAAAAANTATVRREVPAPQDSATETTATGDTAPADNKAVKLGKGNSGSRSSGGRKSSGGGSSSGRSSGGYSCGNTEATPGCRTFRVKLDRRQLARVLLDQASASASAEDSAAALVDLPSELLVDVNCAAGCRVSGVSLRQTRQRSRRGHHRHRHRQCVLSLCVEPELPAADASGLKAAGEGDGDGEGVAAANVDEDTPTTLSEGEQRPQQPTLPNDEEDRATGASLGSGGASFACG